MLQKVQRREESVFHAARVPRDGCNNSLGEVPEKICTDTPASDAGNAVINKITVDKKNMKNEEARRVGRFSGETERLRLGT